MERTKCPPGLPCPSCCLGPTVEAMGALREPVSPGLRQPDPVVASFQEPPAVTHNSDEALSWFLPKLALHELTPEPKEGKLLQPCQRSLQQVTHQNSPTNRRSNPRRGWSHGTTTL